MLPSALPFSRSLRSLRLDGYRAALWAGAAAAVLLFLWGGWVRLAEVPLYEASAAARTVADRAAHPIVSEVSGRVLTVHVVLGQEVAEGDLLLELDADEPRLALAEGRAREGASRAELSKLEAQLAAGEQALAAARDAAAHSLAEAAARKRELELTEVLARDELARLERLASLGGVSELELARARTEAERGAAALETHARGEERAERERAR
ncbi:MAG: biotin/lipoyl-binding protein, partial [Planctomycetota bacterium]